MKRQTPLWTKVKGCRNRFVVEGSGGSRIVANRETICFFYRWCRSLPSTVKVTSHCASPVSQVYVPESSGTGLWIQSWWSAPLLLRSYLRPARMATLFLIQVTVALVSETVQARVTISPSSATVSSGFSSISTVNMGNPKLD